MTELIPLNTHSKSSQKSQSSPSLYTSKNSIIKTVTSPRKNMKVKFDSSIFLDDLFKKALRLSTINQTNKINKDALKYSIGIDFVCYGTYNSKMAYVITRPDGGFESIKIVENHIGNLKCDINRKISQNEKEFIEQFHMMLNKMFVLFGKRWYETSEVDLRLPKKAMFKIIEKNQVPYIWFDQSRHYSINQVLTKFFFTMFECVGIDLTNPAYKWHDKILKICVTLPSDFHSYQRLCLKNCLEQIGLTNKYLLINKSTSLALPFMVKKLNDKTKKFIIDFGSGYMNCSIIECINKREVNVVDQLADRSISSKKFFEKCYKSLKSQAKLKGVLANLDKNLTRYDLYKQMNAERLNISKTETWTIKTQSQEFMLNMKKIGIEQLATSIIEKFKKTTLIDRKTFKIVNDITDILVCSDAVLYEFLEPLLRYHSHKNMNIIFMDNDCASIGAAFLSSSTLNLTTNDILPYRIGVGLYNGVVKNLIDSKTNFPCSGKHLFQTLIDNQTTLRVNLYEGESPLARHCKHISEVLIENINKAPAGSIKIELNINFDQNGVLSAQAKDLNSNKSLPIRINIDSLNCFETIKRTKYALKNSIQTKPDDGLDAELAKQLQDFDLYFDYLINLFRDSDLEAKQLIKRKVYLAKKFISKNRLRIMQDDLEQLRIELDDVLNQIKPKQSQGYGYSNYQTNKSTYCNIL
ncbi:unnamed protein product [Brachionus calyciflorus]|uniref:Uncharacterized protein n=1 Tax=Brachionus calyciflorus TaxID=104777 RepID=A0A813PRS3_9BILA|nr:unnamed protein product [Brachionus calyciflorus]